MQTDIPKTQVYSIKQPKNLSPRIQWLRDYYFKGVQRNWNNEYTAWTNGAPWDFQYEEATFHIVPETYAFLKTFRSSYKQSAQKVNLHPDFWSWSLPERRAWFTREVMLNYLPQEILPGDLLAGARFNVMTSTCLDENQTRKYLNQIEGKQGAREAMLWFHNHGYGNAGATSGHLIPDYARPLNIGWQGIYADIQDHYAALSASDQQGAKGAQLKAMLTAASLPRDLAGQYSQLCKRMAAQEANLSRRDELLAMADMLTRIPWQPPRSFWEAVQSLWLTHMLVMSDENYPGPGDSFGRIDQYLYPFWQKSIAQGMDPEFGKEILKCFWIHANTAYDGMIRTGGNQGITAGFGQLITLSGMGPDGQD